MTTPEFRVLKTDNGVHPPETWANLTADEILGLIKIGPDAPTDVVVAKVSVRSKLVEILTASHAKLQKHERAELKKSGGINRLADKCDPRPHIDEPLDKIIAALSEANPAFAAHFGNAEVKETVARIIGHHKATAMHIERSWHADRNAEAPEAKAFRAKHH